MTSRRKQVKPIKASCQSVDICENKNESLLPKVENDFANWESSQFPESFSFEIKEETKEENTFQMNSEAVEDMKIDEPPSEVSVQEQNVQKEIAQTLLEDSLDEISKKMNKDEAKILPFQSSGGVDFFKCPLCDQSYICGRESLTIHLQDHQNKMKRDDGKHLCCLCSKELSSNSSLERHLLTHSNHRPFSCFRCDKKFTTNGNLSRHIKTSHNNDETIESSIDEVLKKHQTEAEKITQDNSNDNKIGKHRKPSKGTRKEFHSSDIPKTDCELIDKPFSQSCLGIEDQSVPEPIFKAILPANMNFFPPLLSLNINDFSFFQPNRPDNLDFLKPNSTSILSNTPNGKEEKTVNQIPRKNRFANLKSITLTRHRKTKLYLNKLEIHLNRLRKIKKRSCQFDIRCRKCSKIFLHFRNIISHIRKCYSNVSKDPIYCLFKSCNRKFQTKKSFIRHIKVKHMMMFLSNSPQPSPAIEPLNLSMKSSNTDVRVKSLTSPPSNVSLTINSGINDICSQFNRSSLQSESSNNIIDYSVPNNISWNFPTSAMFKTTTVQLNTFSSTNQFISSSPIFTSSPISLSNPFKTEWCNLNQFDLNENPMINLDPHSPKSDLQLQINNLSIRNRISSTISSIARTGLENLSTKSSTTDFSSTSPLADSARLKYGIGIKKKNSYKDAPKLITCPMEGCVQKFPWNSSLMRHILTHTAHKPFKCTRCTKCFSTKSNRERHMTRVHGVRINRSKFKSLQATKANLEDNSKLIEEAVDSEGGNFIDETCLPNDKDINIMELSEEEWIIMDNNDRRAEDISNNLLKLAGQPVVEPNPVRLNNNQISLLDKSISPKSFQPNNKDRFYLDNCF